MSQTAEMQQTFAKAILLESVGHLDGDWNEEVIAFRSGLSLHCSNNFSFIKVLSPKKSSFQALNMIL